jgi:signal transduction histidine kinase
VRADRLQVTRLHAAEQWIAVVRLVGVGFAVLEVGVFSSDFPPGYERATWITTVIFAVGSLAIAVVARSGRHVLALSAVALCFDTLILATYSVLFSFEYGSPTRWVMMFAVVEAALRYGVVGGVGLAVALIPFFVFVERWRADHFGPPGFRDDRVSFPAGVHLLTGLIVGWLVVRLHGEAAHAHAQSAETEKLRDRLARRVDVLEATNRCARALGSSLQLEPAFRAFIRELRGLVPFDRTAILLVDGDSVRVIATGGLGDETVYPRGTRGPLAGSFVEQAVASARPMIRDDMSETLYDEEPELVRLGLRSRLVAPLLVGARAIGALSVMRAQPSAFSADEAELLALLGRLAGTAVQNIRAYEAERQTVEELRRLSALRADFVSLVSHELRSPMAAVIGSARTLEQRWRQLSGDQRDAFLALIGDETQRLANLIGDVLDTSRIEAGTFSYAFSDVDLGALVADAAAAAEIAQDEVAVHVHLNGALPNVRGDRERLRQVVTNLLDNAVKYSSAGDPVDVSVFAESGSLRLEVRDQGPGVPVEQHGLIFEKFGRAQAPGAGTKPGTGLGLFIARSIAEAHGGRLDVSSSLGGGATFTLILPLEESAARP